MRVPYSWLREFVPQAPGIAAVAERLAPADHVLLVPDLRFGMRWQAESGVPGSLMRQASSSSVPIERLALTSVRSAAALSTSTSRKIMVDFVSMEKGFFCSESVSTMPRKRTVLKPKPHEVDSTVPSTPRAR